MKKVFLLLAVLFSALYVSAQNVPLVTYKPVIIDNSGNRIDPFSLDDEYDIMRPQAAPSEIFTTRGYYYDRSEGEWKSLQIKVTETSRGVKLVGVKGKISWQSCDALAKEVNITDSEVIRQNFDFHAWHHAYGEIYF